MEIKLVVCDLDGTLLGPGGSGVDAARAVADFCRSAGVNFTIATGRVFGSVVRYLIHLGLEDPVITNGGALISALNCQPVFERTIDPRVAAAIADELRALKLPFYFTAGKEMLTEWGGPETAAYSENISFDIQVVPSLASLGQSPTQVVVRVPPETADEFVERFKSRWAGKVCVIKSLPHLIEFQALGVSKASALGYLAEARGLRSNEVLAVGDGLNDLDMLAWAGHSACVGNADPEVKAVVDRVSQGFYAEGAMEAIQKTIGNFERT